jgi:hypothetical protein
MAAYFPRIHKQSPSSEEAAITLINLGLRNPRRSLHDDRRACESVAESIRSLHGFRWRILAYSLLPDRLDVLVLGNRSQAEFAQLLKGRIASRLRRLGFRRVWQGGIRYRVIRREEDLAGAISHVLASPVRARIAWSWNTYPWCGSAEWPDIDEWFLSLRRGDRRFRSELENGTGILQRSQLYLGGGSKDRMPVK